MAEDLLVLIRSDLQTLDMAAPDRRVSKPEVVSAVLDRLEWWLDSDEPASILPGFVVGDHVRGRQHGQDRRGVVRATGEDGVLVRWVSTLHDGWIDVWMDPLTEIVHA